jgi:hypothetical protein
MDAAAGDTRGPQEPEQDAGDETAEAEHPVVDPERRARDGAGARSAIQAFSTPSVRPKNKPWEER